jgi:hypothetical protein
MILRVHPYWETGNSGKATVRKNRRKQGVNPAKSGLKIKKNQKISLTDNRV